MKVVTLVFRLLTGLLVTSFAHALDVFVYQNDEQVQVEDKGPAVKLDTAPFALRFSGLEYSAKNPHTTQVVASEDDTFFNRIEVGRPIRDVPFFSNGSKLSAPLRGYDFLMLKGTVFHQLFYVPKQFPNPVEVLEKNGKDYVFEWQIYALRYQGQTVPMRNVGLEKIFFLVFSDQNLNGIVDEDEFIRSEISFN